MSLPYGLPRVTSDAIAIWQAGVDAVRADAIVEREVHADGRMLCVQGREWMLHPEGRLLVVGAGKATFKMAQGLIASLKNLDQSIDLVGWINVPKGTIDGPLDPRIEACEARPLGANEPTPLVITGTQKILQMVADATANDTVLCLLSGGGSALLCAPVKGITLEDKLAVTRIMSSRGATIEQLNQVRSALSRIKRGGLARNCNAGRIITLVLSDVLGDPLETIASGPTFLGSPLDLVAVIKMMRKIVPDMDRIPMNVWINIMNAQRCSGLTHDIDEMKLVCMDLAHFILANNATAVDAAGMEAVRRGYAYYMESSPRSEGSAEDLGRAIPRQCLQLADHPEIQCLITGGEPSVVLPATEHLGKGGRNQHLVLAALDELQRQGVQPELLSKMVILSGGTDGEDGPTDAAGAWLDEGVVQKSITLNLDAQDYLAKCNSYNFFDQTNSLLKTGPTHTNVCDIRVAIFDSRSRP